MRSGGHTVPEGCRAGWAGRAGGGRARACSGERRGDRAGGLEGSQAAWCGSEVALEALGGTCPRP